MMKVTSVEAQKNNKQRVSVFVDNEYAFSLDETDAVLLKIKPGRELSQKDIENCIMECNYTKARDKALDILSRKPVSKKELENALSQKGFDEAVTVQVIEEMTDLGYVDDYEYGSLFLEHCRLKMWGEKKIRYEMKQKGIDDAVIGELLSETDFENDTEEMVKLIISKYGTEDLSDMKTKARITRYFASRGFDFSFIDRLIRLAIEENSNEQ
ncbi:MAG: regulatory protein RecX [Clostridia bacterium]|nr:regulatory protein RecX [Clostridia bacterium]